jgi:hypothetical protein
MLALQKFSSSYAISHQPAFIFHVQQQKRIPEVALMVVIGFLRKYMSCHSVSPLAVLTLLTRLDSVKASIEHGPLPAEASDGL